MNWINTFATQSFPKTIHHNHNHQQKKYSIYENKFFSFAYVQIVKPWTVPDLEIRKVNPKNFSEQNLP